MKKSILLLVLAVTVMAVLFVVMAQQVEINMQKNFENPGYVLKYTTAPEKYYFRENTSYKESYNNQVVFNSTEGDKIVIDKENFMHFDNGSMSSFTKGVLVDLETIDTNPITYYNFSANKVLRKLANGRYVTKNLDTEIEFTNLAWKISGNKYLIAGSNMKIIFSDGSTQEIEDYVEIEYIDNEIVKIYNNDVRYETISSNIYLQIDKDIRLNIGNKCISKNNEIKMTLENMVIDSNDNVTIVDLNEFKEEMDEKDKEEEEEQEEQEQTTTIIQGGTTSANSSGDATANGGSANGISVINEEPSDQNNENGNITEGDTTNPDSEGGNKTEQEGGDGTGEDRKWHN